ncbi:MAG TPA: hypothetical protein VG722_10365 [Tepidisphaeraceae bacterium]|nr:hypothetical protein [Tepidisphaeraceae bacterium]
MPKSKIALELYLQVIYGSLTLPLVSWQEEVVAPVTYIREIAAHALAIGFDFEQLFSRGTQLALGMKSGSPVFPPVGDRQPTAGKQRNEL